LTTLSPGDAVGQAMLEAARSGAFDILVVGYASRFLRNLKQALVAVDGLRQPGIVVEGLHEVGVAVYFADEGILSSDPNHWSAFVREATEVESFSRKHSRRVSEGYAQKRRRDGVPGGNRAPFGMRREGTHPSRLVIVEEEAARVRRAFDLAAQGLPDRQVAATTRLKVNHIREILTNPIFMGELRQGERVAVNPIIDPLLWARVQELRGHWSRRHPGYPSQRVYALAGVLFCAGCGRRLIGDTGRYRHYEVCAAFKEAAPKVARSFSRNSDSRVRGESYRSDLLEAVIPAILDRVATSPALTAETIGALQPDLVADSFKIARIQRDRDQAGVRLARDRDMIAFHTTMKRLDAEETAARSAPSQSPTAAQARAYLEDLPRLWKETSPEGRRGLAQAIFDRVDVLGVTDYTITLTPEAEAHGFVEAFGPEFTCSIGGYGRGERI
jgi:DNA invertase Pin-like site-specific DNA recombinase